MFLCNSITFGLFLKSSLFDNLNRVVARFNLDSYGVFKYFKGKANDKKYYWYLRRQVLLLVKVSSSQNGFNLNNLSCSQSIGFKF